jgi:hypothetical protein
MEGFDDANDQMGRHMMGGDERPGGMPSFPAAASPGSRQCPHAGSEGHIGSSAPAPPNAIETGKVDSIDLHILPLGMSDAAPDVVTPAWLRLQARQLLREFLGAVPRSEPEAALTFLRLDGTARTLTRAQLSAAIDRLRPRQRQIMRLAVEERWPHQKVCAYLNHVSLRTVERDQAEALDLLAML